jgi:hypothetical protein
MIQGTFSPQDLKNANWLHLRPRRALAVFGIFIVIPFLLSLWYAFFGGWSDEVWWVRWAMLGALAYLVALFGIVVPLRIGRTYRQRKDLQRPCTFVPSEAGLRVETEGSGGVKPWSDYLKWKEGKSTFLLYMSDNMYQAIPKRFFSSTEEIDRFRDLVKVKVARKQV